MPYVYVDGEQVEVSDAFVQENRTAPLNEGMVRFMRDERLAETDWWAVADRTMTQAEIDYRQALRDVPQQAGFPENVTWPTKP